MIEISSNLKTVIFLDVTLNLSNNSYKPFSNSNALPIFINVNSNHPPSTDNKFLMRLILELKDYYLLKNIFTNRKEFYN